MNRTLRRLLCLCGWFLAGTSFLLAQSHRIVYVNGSIGHSRGSGASWSEAIDSLHRALDVARKGESVIEIWVGEGTYHPSPDGLSNKQMATFRLRTNVHLYGGFKGHEQALSERTSSIRSVLSGRLHTGDSAYHVVHVPERARGVIIDGFVIQEGKAEGNGLHIAGGGVYVEGSAVMRNLHIRHNRAGMGAGVWMARGALLNSRIEQNEASHYGGGVLLSGGVVNHCVIVHNHVSSFGGGVYIQKNGQLFNSLIYQNTANSYGGGISFVNGMVLNNTLHNNQSGFAGGGIYIPMIAESEGVIANNILYNNRASSVMKGYELYNDIHTGRGVLFSHNLVRGVSAEGAIRGHRRYIRLSSVVYTEVQPFVSERVQHASYLYPRREGAAVNAGAETYRVNHLQKVSNTDLNGHARRTGISVDIGAYEYRSVNIEGIRLSKRRVFSGAKQGDTIGRLLAEGVPKGARVAFSLVPPNNDTFQIVGNVLQVNKVSPQKQVHRLHRLRIKASYLGAEKSDVFSIKVLRSPRSYVLASNKVVSGSPAGTAIGVLRLPGLDRSVAPAFELLNGADTFRIRGVQIEVGSVSPIHVVRPRHALRVRATYAGKVWEKVFEINVTPKHVELALSSEKVLSGLPTGTSIGHFYLTGLHASVPAQVELLSGKDSFRLTGKRLLVGDQSPSHLGQSRHRLRVRAKYKDKEILSAFRLQVVQGQVALALSEHRILDGAKENTRVGYLRLQVSGASTSEARYTLLSGTDTFKVDGQELLVASLSPTYALRPIHKLRVRVNQGGLEHEATLRVEVLPSLKAIELSTKQVPHQAPTNSLIGRISVEGIGEHMQPNFEIVNPTQHFQIKNRNELHIGRQPPDYFQQQVHNLIIRASYAHASHQKMFAIRVSSPPLGADEADESGELTIYPDPTEGPVTITGAAPESVVYIYDTEGDLVDSMVLDKEGRLNLSHLPDRAYVLEVFDSEGTLVRRTIIKSN